MTDNKRPPGDARDALEFIAQLGRAYLASGEQTYKVEQTLRRTATAYGFTEARIVALPTCIFLSLYDGVTEHITLDQAPTKGLRLDQIAEVYRLGDDAQLGTVAPNDGITRIREILRKIPRFGVVGSIVGHTILSVGLAMVLMPTQSNIAAAAVLGTIVGVLKMLNRERPVLAIHTPVVAAALVAALVFLAVKWQLPVDPLYALIPPLVTFLPGGRLTQAMIELAYGDMISGSSLLITGFVQLLLLAFGMAAGAILVGYNAANLVDVVNEPDVYTATHWISWLGVSVFTIGVYLHFSAPKGSLPWMLAVVLVAFWAQQQSKGLFDEPFSQPFSGFFGMLAVTPLSYLIQSRFKGPPAMVTFLPGFWILVPGALSLLSMKYMLSDPDAGIEVLMSVLLGLVSIALGTLFGAGLFKWITETFQSRRS